MRVIVDRGVTGISIECGCDRSQLDAKLAAMGAVGLDIFDGRAGQCLGYGAQIGEDCPNVLEGAVDRELVFKLHVAVLPVIDDRIQDTALAGC